MIITLVETPGRCRWCGCTDEFACDSGCSWANSRLTLCSACVPLDRLMATPAGRRELADIAQVWLRPLPPIERRGERVKRGQLRGGKR